MLFTGCWACTPVETGTLCYWNWNLCRRGEDELSEEYLGQCEQWRERKEFMADWLEYVGEFNG